MNTSHPAHPTTADRFAGYAAELGQQHGASAADWVDLDSLAQLRNGEASTLAAIVDDVDPEVIDSLRVPNLSGEMADGLTPASLLDELGWDYSAETPDEAEAVLEAACEAYEEAADQAFWNRVALRLARQIVAQLEDEG